MSIEPDSLSGDPQHSELVNPWADAPRELVRLGKFLHGFYDESDRGAVLMAASILDEVLCSVIKSFLTDTTQSKMLLEGFNAPLGTFSSRILAAYSLGLLESREFDELEAIRKIRNQFGHSWQKISFEDPKVQSQLQKLPFESLPARRRFNNTIANLLGDLLWREQLVSTKRLLVKEWPYKSGFGRHRE